MSALLEQLFYIPAVRYSIFTVLGILVLLYVLSIVWVARDAYLRNAKWYIWTLVAVIPLVGVIAYCLLRPSLYQIDKDEQELEIAVKKRELMKYGECTNCGYPVESDYVLCPNCLTRLKNLCPTCGRALDSSWRVCPYCATTIAGSHGAMVPVAGRSVAMDMYEPDADALDEPDLGGHAMGAHSL